MKIKTRLCTAAATLLVAGAALFVIGMFVLDWDFKRLDVSEYTAKTYAVESADDVGSVEIEISTFPLNIVRGDEFKLDYYEATGSEVFVDTVDGTLKLVEKFKYDPFATGMFNIGRGEHKYVLTLPHCADITVKGVNCTISVSDIRIGDLRADVDNLDIDLANVDIAGDAYVRSVNLGVDLNNVSAHSVDFSCVNLDGEFNGCEFDKATVRATNADVSVSGSKIGELDAHATNIDAYMERTVCETCAVSGTNADITLKTLSVDRLSVKGKNLSANIEIAGIRSEYSVITKGNGMPPMQFGSTDKTVDLEGGNSNVKLEFTEAEIR